MFPDELNNLKKITSGIVDFRKNNPKNVIETKSVEQRQAEILGALNQFMECVRYLNNRRNKGTVLSLSSEDDVQDALYVMLRPWITDLKYEDPTAKTSNRFVIKDFFIPSAKMILEAKFVRDKKHGKDISKELHDDIEMYRQVNECSKIVFFIYDPEGKIPSADALKSSLEVDRVYDGRHISVELVIKPYQ